LSKSSSESKSALIAIITQINGEVKAIILRHFQMNTIEKIKRLKGNATGTKPLFLSQKKWVKTAAGKI
jgi:hypothetical protein